MLFGRQKGSLVMQRDWKFIRALWPALVLSQTSEKLSVIELKESIVETVNRNFPTIMISVDIPDSCVSAAAVLWDSTPRPSLSQPNVNDIESGKNTLKIISDENLKAYNGLLDELVQSILQKNLHWRHRIMAMNFIRTLVHPGQNYSSDIVRYFVGALIHDSLHERKIAIQVMVFILKQLKRKHPKVQLYKYYFCKFY